MTLRERLAAREDDLKFWIAQCEEWHDRACRLVTAAINEPEPSGRAEQEQVRNLTQANAALENKLAQAAQASTALETVLEQVWALVLDARAEIEHTPGGTMGARDRAVRALDRAIEILKGSNE